MAFEFFYDFVCPYAYLASLEIPTFAREVGADVALRPVLLGGIFRAIGGPDDPNVLKGPAKAAYGARDLERKARARGVVLRRPDGHPRRTVLALRAAIASGDLERATPALFAAYWARGEDLEDPAVVARALDAAGLDGARAVEAAGSEDVKADLRRRTDAAVAKGVFGVPTIVTPSGERFWGVDRFSHARAALLPAATLPFYFDYSSPYAYLAATQVEALAARTGVTLDYRPILLGGLFKAIGTPNVPLFEMPEPKRIYNGEELVRWSKRWGVPFRFASHFPMNTVSALRLTLAAPQASRAELIAGIFRAMWSEDRDISSVETLRAIAEPLGLADATANLSDPELKAKLFAATDEAKARGVFGVPTFVVGDELYWGQDSLADVEAALLDRASAQRAGG
jgi:2-hydroxychromene-2-carboxylate isomerase